MDTPVQVRENNMKKLNQAIGSRSFFQVLFGKKMLSLIIDANTFVQSLV